MAKLPFKSEKTTNKLIIANAEVMKHWPKYQLDIVRPLLRHIAWQDERIKNLENELRGYQLDAFEAEKPIIAMKIAEGRTTTINMPPKTEKSSKGERIFHILKSGEAAINGYLSTHPGESLKTMHDVAEEWVKSKNVNEVSL